MRVYPITDLQLRKTCQSAFVSAPELEDPELTGEAAQKALVESSGKLAFLKLLLPKLKERGHRILLFSQVRPDLRCGLRERMRDLADGSSKSGWTGVRTCRP